MIFFFIFLRFVSEKVKKRYRYFIFYHTCSYCEMICVHKTKIVILDIGLLPTYRIKRLHKVIHFEKKLFFVLATLSTEKGLLYDDAIDDFMKVKKKKSYYNTTVIITQNFQKSFFEDKN